MKKLANHKKIYMISRHMSLMRHQQRMSGIRRHRIIRLKKRTNSSFRTKIVIIALPKTMNLKDRENRLELLLLIEKANRTLLSGDRIKLDFSATTELYPCGTLFFLAHFDTWLDMYPGSILGIYPKDDVVEQLLQHFNVIKRLGLSERTTIESDNVRFWHFKSGKTVDSASYKDLATTVRNNIIHPEKDLFADCLNEAVANTVGHAYDFETPWLPPESHRKWWVVSSLRDEHIFVAIFDRGVTIPGSLRRKPELSDFLRGRRFKDAKLIAAAADSRRTSTKLPHRGKGLPEMLEFSENLASGFLSIASGKGAYHYDAQSGKATKRNLECKIPGTLVLWQIPFEHYGNEHKNDLNS